MRPTNAPAPRQGTFADAVRFEWTKFRTLRSHVYTAAVTVVLAVGFGALYSGGAASGYGELSPDRQAGFDPTSISLQGGLFLAQLAIGVLGVLIVSSEYASGMIRTTLTAVPRRGMLLAAKALVLGTIAAGIGQVAAFGAFVVGQSLMADTGVPHATLGQPHVLRAVIGAGLYLMLIGWLGVALGVLLRATAGAITALVATTFVALALAQVLGETFARLWPTIAGMAITTTLVDPDGPSVWAGFGLLCAFVAVLLGAGYTAFRSRDA